jgi:hypothetical protein
VRVYEPAPCMRPIRSRCGRIDVILGEIQDEIVANVHGECAAEREGILRPQLDCLQQRAFHGDGTAGDARRLYVYGWNGFQLCLVDFLHAGLKLDGGDVHGHGRCFEHEIDDKPSCFANIAAGVVGATGLMTADADTHDGRIARKSIEKREGSGVEPTTDTPIYDANRAPQIQRLKSQICALNRASRATWAMRCRASATCDGSAVKYVRVSSKLASARADLSYCAMVKWSRRFWLQQDSFSCVQNGRSFP